MAGERAPAAREEASGIPWATSSAGIGRSFARRRRWAHYRSHEGPEARSARLRL
jgi:hypothetical protein